MKLRAADSKLRYSDVPDLEQMLRLVQSIPSQKSRANKVLAGRIDHYKYHQGGASSDDERTCKSCGKRRLCCPRGKGGFRRANGEESCKLT